MLILATTSSNTVLQQLQLDFEADIAVPNINKPQELGYVMHDSCIFAPEEIEQCLGEIRATTGRQELGVGIRTVLTGMTIAQHSHDKVERFAEIVAEAVAKSVVE